MTIININMGLFSLLNLLYIWYIFMYFMVLTEYFFIIYTFMDIVHFTNLTISFEGHFLLGLPLLK